MSGSQHPNATPVDAPDAGRADVTAGLSGGEVAEATTAPGLEQAHRAVMHPDYHDPDWRYYFCSMAG